jgi:hypothetical protein
MMTIRALVIVPSIMMTSAIWRAILRLAIVTVETEIIIAVTAVIAVANKTTSPATATAITTAIYIVVKKCGRII